VEYFKFDWEAMLYLARSWERKDVEEAGDDLGLLLLLKVRREGFSLGFERVIFKAGGAAEVAR
jgi:hypothetical protein